MGRDRSQRRATGCGQTSGGAGGRFASTGTAAESTAQRLSVAEEHGWTQEVRVTSVHPRRPLYAWRGRRASCPVRGAHPPDIGGGRCSAGTARVRVQG
ncbi:hypothetical protein FM110_13320 [Brachybacterium nesterenkovii]|uniref:Uncharacterized protein n=1 Tax=Brachybacterium nesterenkovii TaxID=47847 RepID=A0A1X6X939_9MICO|nr:hypothetical protein FM110_13320 [Brachybacterium nesterenkovii]